jgi:heme A synthase
MVFILTIANICGGLLLGLATLDKWDGERNFFNKIAGVLAPFQTVIGGALVVLSLIRIFGGHNCLFNFISLLGGFLLLTHVIGKAPAFQESLRKLSDKLMPFKAIIGIVLLVIGILNLIN